MNRVTATGLRASMQVQLCLMSLLLVLTMPLAAQTRGPQVTLEREPADAWKALREPDITARERDRCAILAMAGDYRTTFHFIETMLG